MKLRDLIDGLDNVNNLARALQTAKSELNYIKNPGSEHNHKPAIKALIKQREEAIAAAQKALDDALDEELPGLLTRGELVAAIEAAKVHASFNVPSFKENWQDQTADSKDFVLIDPETLIKRLTE
jgi:hypothetical protein